MPIHQAKSHVSRAYEHIKHLQNRFPNVQHSEADLTPLFDTLVNHFPGSDNSNKLQLTLANTRARLRMTTLYYFAGLHNRLVAGTGNKIEDFGVGFYTKYGDGGVDISPIGDCLKTEVWEMGRELGILEDIIRAAPTDGLWDDARTDEDQIGMNYPDLERMMALDFLKRAKAVDSNMPGSTKLSGEDRVKLKRYQELRSRNLHKMQPIPVFKK
jgi:NAD+ synthase